MSVKSFYRAKIFQGSLRCGFFYNYHRGVAFLPHGAPKITAVVHLQSCTESGLLLLTLLRAGMERFLPSASGSSAAVLKPCSEPTTCKFKSQVVTSVHQCPCGRSMHGFCGRGIGKEGHGQQRECTDCQKRTAGDKTGSSSPMEWMTKTTSRTTAGDFLQQSPG